MKDFPNNTEPLRATIARALELKGFEDALAIVQSGEIDANLDDHDAWDNGIDYFKLAVRVPIEQFFRHEGQIKELEEQIKNICETIFRAEKSTRIISITIYPADLTAFVSKPDGQSTKNMPAFWTPGCLRLFISHTSEHKLQVDSLQNALAFLGVSCFVAHVDIEPTKDWENEITRGLQTMDALLAVLTPDFPTSRWCDQEVGVAFGQGKLVIPIRAGLDPYGFMAKHQALTTNISILASSAVQIVEILLKNDATSILMTNALVKAFVNAWSFAGAKTLIGLLEGLPKLSAEHATQIYHASTQNNQIVGSWGVPARVTSLLKKHGFGEFAA
jgi:TIR domain